MLYTFYVVLRAKKATMLVKRAPSLGCDLIITKKSIIDKVNLPVSNHLCRAGHNLSNLRCILLRSGFTTTTQRLRGESKWILALNTHNQELNKDLGVLSGQVVSALLATVSP